MGKSPGQELAAPISDQELALAADVQHDLDDGDLVVPVLKVCQSLTGEVVDGDAKAGDFLNSLTGENFGPEVQLTVAAYQKGRFYSDKESGRSWATTLPVAPDSWPPEFAGQPFTELDEAEERYRERVNAKEIAWEKGPKISTTHNFISVVEGSEIPVRLSLMRTNAPAARKLKTLLRFGQAPWDHVYVLKTETQRSSRQEPYQAVTVKKGPKASQEQRAAAMQLALATRAGRVTEADAEAIEDAPARPADPEDALAV